MPAGSGDRKEKTVPDETLNEKSNKPGKNDREEIESDKKETKSDKKEIKSEDKNKKKSGKKSKKKAKKKSEDKNARQKKPYYDNRELSWLKFNLRVLEEAEDVNVPLCERLSFASIFCSNLDEYFMVRVGALYDQVLMKSPQRDSKTEMTAKEQLNAIFKRTRKLLYRRDLVYAKLTGELKGVGIELMSFSQLSYADSVYLEQYFYNSIMPLLSPQVISKKQPFPFLNNNEIYAVAMLSGKNSEKLCIVPCSNGVFGRLVQVPSDKNRYMLVEEVILHFITKIFDRYTVKSSALVRITRSADIDIDDQKFNYDVMDYRDSMEKLIKMRQKLCPVKIEYTKESDTSLIDILCNELKLNKDQTFDSESPLDFSFISEIQDLLRNCRDLFFQRRLPQPSRQVDDHKSMIEQIRQDDILLSYPYESMNPFIRLLQESVYDSRVVSIKMTLYRVAKDSRVVEALIDAAENGKEVVVLVELRARFDEQNNIEWSRRMEDAGCRIIYGIDRTKVHSKICLISYNDGGNIRHISQIGTGNYNEKTAKLYTDLSLMTANEDIAGEIAENFNQICMEQVVEKTEHLLVAPKCLQDKVIDMIQDEIDIVKAGGQGYIGLKMNSLTDKKIIDKLIEASQAGVKIDMVVRGICCLVAGVKGYTDNITVRSIVGRYLEHSRIYIFGTPDRDRVYISSADFMTRNTIRRVEVAAPVYSDKLKERIRDMFKVMLSDNVKARIMDSKGNYHKKEAEEKLLNSQEYFLDEAAAGNIV